MGAGAVARSVPYDNSVTAIPATSTQDAIDYVINNPPAAGDGFMREYIPAATTTTVPLYYQMHNFFGLVIDGTLVINGTLILVA